MDGRQITNPSRMVIDQMNRSRLSNIGQRGGNAVFSGQTAGSDVRQMEMIESTALKKTPSEKCFHKPGATKYDQRVHTFISVLAGINGSNSSYAFVTRTDPNPVSFSLQVCKLRLRFIFRFQELFPSDQAPHAPRFGEGL